MIFKLMKLHNTPCFGYFYEAPGCVIQTQQEFERYVHFLTYGSINKLCRYAKRLLKMTDSQLCKIYNTLYKIKHHKVTDPGPFRTGCKVKTRYNSLKNCNLRICALCNQNMQKKPPKISEKGAGAVIDPPLSCQAAETSNKCQVTQRLRVTSQKLMISML